MQNPDRWVILEFVNDKHASYYKILSSWYGGYLGSDSWRLSSDIKSVIESDDNSMTIETISGTQYNLGYKSVGMSGYTSSVYQGFQDDIKNNNLPMTLEISNIKDATALLDKLKLVV